MEDEQTSHFKSESVTPQIETTLEAETYSDFSRRMFENKLPLTKPSCSAAITDTMHSFD